MARYVPRSVSTVNERKTSNLPTRRGRNGSKTEWVASDALQRRSLRSWNALRATNAAKHSGPGKGRIRDMPDGE